MSGKSSVLCKKIDKSISVEKRLTLLGNFDFASTKRMLANVPHAEVVKALRVALDFFARRHIIILARTSGVGGCGVKVKRA